MKLQKVEFGPNDTRWFFWCPGCKNHHSFSTPRWQFDGDIVSPTFSPSLRVYTTDRNGKEYTVCHLFVRAGKIEYCGDSPHKLAGQTVLMEDFEPLEL